jgi:hypothetical protein
MTVRTPRERREQANARLQPRMARGCSRGGAIIGRTTQAATPSPDNRGDIGLALCCEPRRVGHDMLVGLLFVDGAKGKRDSAKPGNSRVRANGGRSIRAIALGAEQPAQ